MKITNENSKTFGVICGWRYGTDIVVTGLRVLLTFHSDSEVAKEGFNISFTAVPRPGKCSQGNVPSSFKLISQLKGPA